MAIATTLVAASPGVYQVSYGSSNGTDWQLSSQPLLLGPQCNGPAQLQPAFQPGTCYDDNYAVKLNANNQAILTLCPSGCDAATGDCVQQQTCSPTPTIAPTLTHTVCSATQCITVNGAGTDDCVLGQACSTYRACQGTTCTQQTGTQSSTCFSDTDTICTQPEGPWCSNGQCIQTPGGTDTCTPGASCTTQRACQGTACTATTGTGLSTCVNDAQCTQPTPCPNGCMTTKIVCKPVCGDG